MCLQIHFHGQDWASLHKFIIPEVLPQEYGGHKPEIDFSKAHQYLYDNAEKLMGKVHTELNFLISKFYCSFLNVTDRSNAV
jgi:hypothetical protein